MALTVPDTSAIVLLNGQAFTGWTHFQITQAFDRATGDCTLRMSPQPGVPLPVKIGDVVQVICAKRPVLTGHVHRIWGEHDDKTHVIQAQIRDKTQDLIDSTIGPKLDVTPPTTMSAVASQTLSAMGLGSIKVIDRVGSAPFGLAEKVSAPINARGLEFLEKWAAKRHSVLTTDGLGNLVIDQNQGRRLAGAYIRCGLPDDPTNNVKKSQFGIDDFNRHNTTAVAGQKSSTDRGWEKLGKGEPQGQGAALSSRYGVASDTSVRPERRRHMRGGEAHSGSSPKESAKWHQNSMRAKSNEYVCTVPGFTTSDGATLWWPGNLVPVYDWAWNINADLLLKEVEFQKEAGATHGASTQLKFTLEDGFTDQASRGGGPQRTSSGPLGESNTTHEPVSPQEMGINDPDTEVDVDSGN